MDIFEPCQVGEVNCDFKWKAIAIMDVLKYSEMLLCTQEEIISLLEKETNKNSISKSGFEENISE